MQSRFHWVLARATYPGLLVGSLGLAWGLLELGLSPSATAVVAFLVALGFTALLERVYPHDAAARIERGDLAYLGLVAVVQGLAKAGGQLVAVAAGLALTASLGPRPWPGGWPLAAQVALAVLTADLVKYGLHRLAHERPWWWRFHAEHHAPASVHAFNGVRLHPVNALWNLGVDAVMPLVLGLEGRAVVLAAVVRGTVAVLQHANMPLVLGPLDWIFSTPTLHRWHHSTKLEEANSNYGSTLIVWDLLFRTRFDVPGAAPAAFGLADGAPHPRRFSAQLAWPWCSRAPAARRARCLA
ncbi:MAG: sterol desaturase family protein [Polyangiaceae bacterium]